MALEMKLIQSSTADLEIIEFQVPKMARNSKAAYCETAELDKTEFTTRRIVWETEYIQP